MTLRASEMKFMPSNSEKADEHHVCLSTVCTVDETAPQNMHTSSSHSVSFRLRRTVSGKSDPEVYYRSKCMKTKRQHLFHKLIFHSLIISSSVSSKGQAPGDAIQNGSVC